MMMRVLFMMGYFFRDKPSYSVTFEIKISFMDGIISLKA